MRHIFGAKMPPARYGPFGQGALVAMLLGQLQRQLHYYVHRLDVLRKHETTRFVRELDEALLIDACADDRCAMYDIYARMH